MTVSSPYTEQRARERYLRSLFRAQLTDLLGMMSGENTDLMRYDEVAKHLKARQQVEQGIQMVPIEKIVGSVGRYRDFTRTFLPRAGVSQHRWARIDSVMNSLEGLPPIELFQIGDVYFVRDGNHRVSVARANGLSEIEAYVTEVKTPIPLTVDDFDRDQWLIKADHAEFLAQTRLDQLRPDHALRLTEPGRYEILRQHIEVHRYLRNQESHSDALSWEDAVVSWYDSVYMPVVAAIRAYDLLYQFPQRTEADLYLWIAHHREELAHQYNLAPLSPDVAVSTFAETHSERMVDNAVFGLRNSVRRVFGLDHLPLGMSADEFRDARLRRAEGEIPVGEAVAEGEHTG